MAEKKENTQAAFPPQGEKLTTGSAATEHRTIDAQQLFHGEREIWIEHDGVRYRLRITRRNRLILQK